MPFLDQIIDEYISDFTEKQSLSYVVKPSIPIVWFGNMEKYKASPKKVVTVALNPSLKEFEGDRFDIVDLQKNDAIIKLSQTLSLYFKRHPYSWFKDFERVLSSFDTSYYETKENTALHIDIYSAIATNPTWGSLSETEKKDIGRTDLFQKLLHFLNPDIVIFSANQKVFKEVFSDYICQKRIDSFNGKKGFFISKYKSGNKVLISGRNYRGQPFGGLSNNELLEAMKQLL